MKSILRFSAFLLAASSVALVSTRTHSAGQASVELCITQMKAHLAQQERVFHERLFGRKHAQELPKDSTLYDTERLGWIKTDNNTWTIVDEKGKPVDGGDVRSDDQMDEEREWDGMNDVAQENEEDLAQEGWFALEGIFEQKSVLTSQIIPDILQSVRALQCRTSTVCDAVTKSFEQVEAGEDGTIRITVPGCRTMLIPRLDGCAFGNWKIGAGEQSNKVQGVDISTVTTMCQPLAAQLMERNATLVRVAVSYDAAYRSLLQIAGSLDQFLWGFNGSILAPVEQTIPLLENLSRLPCFTAQCNG